MQESKNKRVITIFVQLQYDEFGKGWGGLLGQIASLPRKVRNDENNILLLGLVRSNHFTEVTNKRLNLENPGMTFIVWS